MNREQAAALLQGPAAQKNNRIRLTPGKYLASLKELKFLDGSGHSSIVGPAFTFVVDDAPEDGSPVGSEFGSLCQLNPTGKNAALRIDYAKADCDAIMFALSAGLPDDAEFSYDNPEEDRGLLISDTEAVAKALVGTQVRVTVVETDKPNPEGGFYTRMSFSAA